MTGLHKPIKLPPLKTLRVHNPKRQMENPCVVVMANVLACWASSGYMAAGCAAVENQLRQCMDRAPPVPAPPNTINYHLARMKKHLTHQTLRK